MIIFPHEHVPQGGENWLRLRLGRPTASEFGSIITPAKGAKSASQKSYAARHVDERVCGGPKDVKPYWNENMQRGKDREHEACMAFERETGYYTSKVGFVVTDDGRFGCSPDRLVHADEESPPFAILEVKNYAADQHMLWEEEEGIATDFKCQVHGEIFVCSPLTVGFWMNHCPPYSPVIRRVDRDDFTIKLGVYLDDFDVNVFKPMLARQCENAALRRQVEEFDAEYKRMCEKAKSLAHKPPAA